MRKSNLITLAAAAAIITFGGGAAAQAGGLLDGGDIRNGSITSKDLANDTVKTADLADNAVRADQLAPNSVDETAIQDDSITTEALEPEAETAVETVTESTNGQLGGSLPGSLIASWTDEMGGNVTEEADSNMMVYLDVQVNKAASFNGEVEVAINNDSAGEIFCVANVVNGVGSCQAARLATDRTLTVTYVGATKDGVDVQVNVIRAIAN